MPQKRATARIAYDAAGAQYHTHRTSAENFFNSYIEAPAMFRAVPRDLRGKTLLDMGCGGGVHLAEYVRRGAECAGIDISATLIHIAAQRLPKCSFSVGSMTRLPFKPATYDVVTSSLALHYARQKMRVFREVARVLKPGGEFIFTTGNPLMDARQVIEFSSERLKVIGTIKIRGRNRALGNYFDPAPVVNHSTSANHSYVWYPSTYEQLLRWALRAGFELIGYSDCKPVRRARQLFPQDYAVYARVPFFCLFHLRKRR